MYLPTDGTDENLDQKHEASLLSRLECSPTGAERKIWLILEADLTSCAVTLRD